MKITPTEIEGVLLIESPIFEDNRGTFREWFKSKEFNRITGKTFEVAQANTSNSSIYTVRGIHYSLSKVGQAKLITCTSGRIMDVVVDLRMNSNTFGQSFSVELSERTGFSVFISEKLGHGFISLEDNSTVTYLLSSEFSPANEFEINPLDPQLGINWGVDVEKLNLSVKDRTAPSLEEQKTRKLLPNY